MPTLEEFRTSQYVWTLHISRNGVMTGGRGPTDPRLYELFLALNMDVVEAFKPLLFELETIRKSIPEGVILFLMVSEKGSTIFKRHTDDDHDEAVHLVTDAIVACQSRLEPIFEWLAGEYAKFSKKPKSTNLADMEDIENV